MPITTFMYEFIMMVRRVRYYYFNMSKSFLNTEVMAKCIVIYMYLLTTYFEPSNYIPVRKT